MAEPPGVTGASPMTQTRIPAIQDSSPASSERYVIGTPPSRRLATHAAAVLKSGFAKIWERVTGSGERAQVSAAIREARIDATRRAAQQTVLAIARPGGNAAAKATAIDTAFEKLKLAVAPSATIFTNSRELMARALVQQAQLLDVPARMAFAEAAQMEIVARRAEGQPLGPRLLALQDAIVQVGTLGARFEAGLLALRNPTEKNELVTVNDANTAYGEKKVIDTGVKHGLWGDLTRARYSIVQKDGTEKPIFNVPPSDGHDGEAMLAIDVLKREIGDGQIQQVHDLGLYAMQSIWMPLTAHAQTPASLFRVDGIPGQLLGGTLNSYAVAREGDGSKTVTARLRWHHTEKNGAVRLVPAGSQSAIQLTKDSFAEVQLKLKVRSDGSATMLELPKIMAQRLVKDRQEEVQ